MSAVREVVAVDVWRDYPGERSDGGAYSVSACDVSGDEVRCIGGGNRIDAWEIATRYADANGVRARLMSESGEVVREYIPESAEVQS